MNYKIAIITPMANESKTFDLFIVALNKIINDFKYCKIYLVVDKVSKDNTLDLCKKLSKKDDRYISVWAPENNNVVDAYLLGYREALEDGNDIFIEMDAGLSHDPRALPMFVRVLNEGNDCVFGSRFINGGSILNSNWKRTLLSRGGTIITNILLGTRFFDMTSGYQGFHANVVRGMLNHQILSKGHYYQTELRYLLRKTRFIEVPIHYSAPSPSVSINSVLNSIKVLFYYFYNRIISRAVQIDIYTTYQI